MNNYEKLLYKTNRQKRQLRILMAKNKLLKEKVKQLENTLNEVREYILEKCPHSAVFRNEHIDKIYEIIKK